MLKHIGGRDKINTPYKNMPNTQKSEEKNRTTFGKSRKISQNTENSETIRKHRKIWEQIGKPRKRNQKKKNRQFREKKN